MKGALMSPRTSREHWDAAHAARASKLSAAAHILPTLTRGELQALIARNPAVWAEFAPWLATLPETR